MTEGGETVTVVVRYGKENIDLKVDAATETFADIKQRLADKTGLAPADQNLSFNKLKDMEVYDDKCLSFYRFNGGCFMNLEKK